MTNKFIEQNKDLIKFSYDLFDRMILSGWVCYLQKENNFVYFMKDVCGIKIITPNSIKKHTLDFVAHIEKLSEKEDIPLIAVEKKSDKSSIAEKYYDDEKKGIFCILKSQEYGRTYASYLPKKVKNDETYRRICKAIRPVNHYYFYINDEEWRGISFIKVCSYLPFNMEFYLNGHNWLETQFIKHDIKYKKVDNCFVEIEDIDKANKIIKSFNDDPVWQFGDRWIYKIVKLFTPKIREKGFYYRYYVKQIEYSNNICFKSKEVLDGLFSRIIDNHRTIGNPDSISNIFQKRITKSYRGVCQTNINHFDEHPCIKSRYKKVYIKQYNKKGVILRTEPVINDLKDLGLLKSVVNLPRIREVAKNITNRYLKSISDVSLRFTSKNGLEKLAESVKIGASGKSITGIRISNPRIMMIIKAAAKSSNLIHGFTNKELREEIQTKNGLTEEEYSSTKMGYDLKRLLVKNIIKKIEGTYKYVLTEFGIKICKMLLLIKDKIFNPIISGIKSKVTKKGEKLSRIERYYFEIVNNLDKLVYELGFG